MSAIIKILAGITIFKRPWNARTDQEVQYFLRQYAEYLKDYSLEAIQRGVDDLMRSHTRDAFPQPAEMISAIIPHQNAFSDDLRRLKPVERIEEVPQSIEERQEVGRMMGELVKQVRGW